VLLQQQMKTTATGLRRSAGSWGCGTDKK